MRARSKPRLAAAGVLLSLVALASCHPPEADYWRDRRKRPRPFPGLEFETAWDIALPFCPRSVRPADGGRVEVEAEGGRLGIDATGEAVELPATPGGPAGEEDDPVIAAALTRAYGRPVAWLGPARWKHLALVAVPEDGALLAVHAVKGSIAWRVRAGARVAAAPQIHRGRVIFQSLDNYLYCLVPDNGHEIWRARATHRLSRPVAFWRDRVLVIPETAAALQAFDLYDGSPAGSWSLPEEDEAFVSPPGIVGDLVVAAHARHGTTVCRLAAARMEAKTPRERPGEPSIPPFEGP